MATLGSAGAKHTAIAMVAFALIMSTTSARPAELDYSSARPTSVASLEKDAARGHAHAQAKLGFAFATGRGVPQNFVLAAKWYRRAAMQGDATGQYLLGLSYDHGQGVPEDTVLAEKWLILATARARGREREYFARIRDAVASKMSPAEIAQAQRLAYLWWAARGRRLPRTVAGQINF